MGRDAAVVCDEVVFEVVVEVDGVRCRVFERRKEGKTTIKISKLVCY